MTRTQEILWLNKLNEYLYHSFNHNMLTNTTLEDMNSAIRGSIIYHFGSSKPMDSFVATHVDGVICITPNSPWGKDLVSALNARHAFMTLLKDLL